MYSRCVGFIESGVEKSVDNIEKALRAHDAAACRQAVLSALCDRKGVSLEAEAFDLKAYRQQQYDLLAAGIRQSLDMALIYRILEEGV